MRDSLTQEKGPAAVGDGEPGGNLKLPDKFTFLPPRRQVPNTWHSAKAVGDAAELALADYFTGLGFTVSKTVGRADFDLSILKRIEVKRDDAAERTGNAAVEMAYNGEPSGIFATSADLWAFVVGDEALILATSILRGAVASGRFTETMGGDGGRSRLVLIPLAELRRMRGVQVIRLQAAMSRAV